MSDEWEQALIERAREEGRKEGRKLAQQYVARKMLARKYDVAIISEITGLSLEELVELKEEKEEAPKLVLDEPPYPQAKVPMAESTRRAIQRHQDLVKRLREDD